MSRLSEVTSALMPHLMLGPIALPMFTAALLLLPDLRRKVFTAPLFNWFQKTLPPMSQTERDAIDAGTVWWDGELFSGRPDWNQLLAYPKVQLTDEEQAFLFLALHGFG